MRLSEELQGALTEWKRTASGYELKTTKGVAKLFKKGKRWMVSVDGEEQSLGNRASFDHAEGFLVKMGAKPIKESLEERRAPTVPKKFFAYDIEKSDKGYDVLFKGKLVGNIYPSRRKGRWDSYIPGDAVPDRNHRRIWDGVRSLTRRHLTRLVKKLTGSSEEKQEALKKMDRELWALAKQLRFAEAGMF